MSYVRFGLMIATSTVVMFGLMYLNTYAWEHVFFSETRAYMAIVMGATMAVIMLGYMLGMYSSARLNAAIFGGAVIAFAVSLWLVRSQSTVSGQSYLRAMIPHHSIAIMTSERAQIRDARVAVLARDIIDAQRREISQMHYLVAELAEGRTVEEVYRDPPARIGTVRDALGNTLVASLHPSTLPQAEADQILADAGRCTFGQGRGTDPILWAEAEGDRAALKLNGVLVPLRATDASFFAADGISVSVRPLGEDADWRADAELVFALDEGLKIGYRGFWTCPAAG